MPTTFNNPGAGEVLKIAIQKSGRLYDDSIRLLKDCGIDIKNGVNKLKAEAENFPGDQKKVRMRVSLDIHF